MLPYPSGNLHIGHIRNYAVSDILHRHMKSKGWNAMLPMGWDSFGLPAENAAALCGVGPSEWVNNNIRKMRHQMQAINLAIDWRREIITSCPSYYRWSQLLFLRFLAAGFVSRKLTTANWDPKDKTVLSNEQVINGKGWRSGSFVQQRRVPSYFLKTTCFAEELIDGLLQLSWPCHVKTMQEKWVNSKSTIQLRMAWSFGVTSTTSTCFWWNSTSRTVLVVHPLSHFANVLLKSNLRIRAFAEWCSGSVARTPDLSCWKHLGIPTGLLASVPSFRFPLQIWLGWYNNNEDLTIANPSQKDDYVFLRVNHLVVRNQIVGVVSSDKASTTELSAAIVEELKRQGTGSLRCSFSLTDWCLSRQRLWGTPIPTTICEVCGVVPVRGISLPTETSDKLGTKTSSGGCSVRLLGNCASCCCKARKEHDTLDTFFDSSWYFSRYPSWNNLNHPVDDRCSYWLPIDTYVGGVEHSVLHLLYSRFFTKTMKAIRILRQEEPIKKLVVQGAVTSEAFYSRSTEGRVVWVDPPTAKVKLKGTPQKQDVLVFSAGKSKMSKSRLNGFNPQILVGNYGADVARMFIISLAPIDRAVEWSTRGINGVVRFISKLLSFGINLRSTNSRTCDPDHQQDFEVVAAKIASGYDSLSYHNILPSLTTMLWLLLALLRNPKCEGSHRFMVCKFLSLANPVIPHVTSVVWRRADCHLRFGSINTNQPATSEYDRSNLPNSCLAVQIENKVRREVDFKQSKPPKNSVVQQLSEGLIVLRYVTQKALCSARRLTLHQRRAVNVLLAPKKRSTLVEEFANGIADAHVRLGFVFSATYGCTNTTELLGALAKLHEATSITGTKQLFLVRLEEQVDPAGITSRLYTKTKRCNHQDETVSVVFGRTSTKSLTAEVLSGATGGTSLVLEVPEVNHKISLELLQVKLGSSNRLPLSNESCDAVKRFWWHFAGDVPLISGEITRIVSWVVGRKLTTAPLKQQLQQVYQFHLNFVRTTIECHDVIGLAVSLVSLSQVQNLSDSQCEHHKLLSWVSSLLRLQTLNDCSAGLLRKRDVSYIAKAIVLVRLIGQEDFGSDLSLLLLDNILMLLARRYWRWVAVTKALLPNT